MEVNEKLKHLTNKQIEEVIAMYQDKSIKISEILNRYNIEVKPNNLLKILPPTKTDNICKICGENLYQNIRARTLYSYGNENQDKFCLNCGHQEYVNNGWNLKTCSCKGCEDLLRIENENKKKLIKNTYAKNENIIEFDELIFEDQVKLIYLLFNNTFHNTSKIAPMEESDTWIKYLNRMVEIKAISVSSESDINAFCKEDFPNKYYVAKVIYDVNVNFDEKTLLDINNNSYFVENNDEEDLITLLKDYIYMDLIERFEEMLVDRRLQLHISEKANNRFIELIDQISYTQILELCKRVAVFFSDKTLTGNTTKSIAKNAVLLNVSKFYDRAIESDWILNHADLEYVGEELNFYIERVLNKEITILKDVACVDNLRNWKRREIDYSNRIGFAEE